MGCRPRKAGHQMSKNYGKIVTHKGAIIRERESGWQAEINWQKRRIRHTEKTLAAAKTWTEVEITRLHNEGTSSLALTEDQRHDAVRALKIIPTGMSLESVVKEYVAAKTELDGSPLAGAVTFWKSHHKPAGGVKTVNELLKDYVRVKKEKGKRDRYITDIQYRIGTFAKVYGTRHVHTITTHEINDWIQEHGCLGTSQINYLTYLTGFFNYAKRAKLIEVNPADSDAIERPTVDEKMTEVFTVDAVSKFMAAAANKEPKIIPMLALGFFAGLRTTEIRGISWESINFESKRIKIIPAVAKKRRQRFIAMQDNLIEWLLPYRKQAGPVAVPFMTYRRNVEQIIRSSGVKWVHNGMRHTFASCHLAKFQDMKTLVIEMGHADKADVLYGHYLDLVAPEDATRYWNIRPMADDAKVVTPISHSSAK